MIYKIIITYLIGVLIAVNFKIDYYFFIFCFLMSFIVLLYVLYNVFYIKDMSFKSKEFLKYISNWFFLFSVFLISIIYSQTKLKDVSYNTSMNDIRAFEGKIVSIRPLTNGKQLTIKPENISNKLIRVDVTQFQNFELFDRVHVEGDINFNNFQTYYEDLPLFFSYQYSNLFYNSNFFVSYPKSVEKVNTNKNFWERLIVNFYNLSETLKNTLGEYMSEPYASIAEGISMGNQENIIKSIKDIFRNSGLIHILVLSGANVSFIILLVWYFLSKLKSFFWKKYRVIFILLISWIFIFITGLAPPSVRAGIMSSSNILGEQYGKNISTFQTLLFSLFILVLINPLTLVYSPSLHLSFLACFGLFIATPKIEKFLKKYIHNKFLNFLFSSSIGIFIFTTPYILALTGKSSLFGTVLTFFVEPLVLLVTILSFLIIFFSFFLSLVSNILGIVNCVLVKIILKIAEFGGNVLPIINVQVGKIELIIYYLILFVIFYKNENDIIKQTNESK